MTQNNQILAHLETGNTITQLEALNLYGSMRLGARIWELRELGHDIKREMILVKTRDEPAYVARYSL